MTIKRLGNQGSITYYEKVEEILTSGTSWTVPSGVTTIDMVICIGGGQGGTGGNAAGATNASGRIGGDGGQGGYVATFFRLPVSGTVSYAIGAGSSGGAGGIAQTNNGTSSGVEASAGGSTWFGKSTYVAAGGNATDSTPNGAGTTSAGRYFNNFGTEIVVPIGNGGRGGTYTTNEVPGAGNNGNLYYEGFNNTPIRVVMSYIETGGGGGGSGTSSTASVQYGRPGAGGNNTSGGTAGAQGGQATNIGLTGGNGSGYGGGGGGGAGVKANGVAGGAGGAGANGAIIIRYTRAVTVSLREGSVV